MKFVISAATCNALNTQGFDEIRPVLAALGKTHDEMDAIRRSLTEMKEVTHLKNMSVTLVNGDWIFEINDELMFKQLSLIGKIARFIVPLIGMFKMFSYELKRDLDGIESFIGEEK